MSQVALIGPPNSGKSTILNALAGRKLAIVTQLRNTTQKPLQCTVADGSRRILLTDTPGIVHRRDVAKVPHETVRSALQTIPAAKHLCIVLDSTLLGRAGLPPLEQFLFRRLAEHCVPATLVLNKWDLYQQRGLPRHMLARHVRLLHLLYPPIQQVLVLSARASDDVQTLRRCLLGQTPGDYRGAKADWTSVTLESHVPELVREQFMLRLPHELAYRVRQSTKVWTRSPTTGVLHIVQLVHVPHKRLLAAFCGRDNLRLRAVERAVAAQLAELYPQSPIHLSLEAKVDS